MSGTTGTGGHPGSLFDPVAIEGTAAAADVLARWARAGGGSGAPGAAPPEGAPRYWGVPFVCATAPGGAAPGWVVAGAAAATIPLDGAGAGEAPGHLVLLHVCAPPAAPDAAPGQAPDPILSTIPAGMTQLGRRVGDYVLVYGDGSEHRQPLRWRFEIGGPDARERPGAFAARPLSAPVPVEFRGPAPRNAWGRWQTSVGNESRGSAVCVYALANPHPERALRALRVEAAGGTEI